MQDKADAKTPMYIEEIMARLPHRYPFLLVDRVLEIQMGRSIVALKNVTFNETHFIGHFPVYPVMPGVLIIEALAQAGGILAWEEGSEDERQAVPYLAGVEKARFKQPVRPGDQLVLKVEIARRRRGLWCFAARGEVEGKLVAEANIMMISGQRP
ncbi:MAG TPA: 3-hydroxyacyl-ACP dehydratase FabZ [Gammaproteobacteria bacterium]|nr:3-hydroxyacyl-ACP dehydratase FabZ [Gammaproteobacteria bacterium]